MLAKDLMNPVSPRSRRSAFLDSASVPDRLSDLCLAREPLAPRQGTVWERARHWATAVEESIGFDDLDCARQGLGPRAQPTCVIPSATCRTAKQSILGGTA